MSHETDLSFLDRPEILETVFPVAYDRLYLGEDEPDLLNSVTHLIEVEPDIKIGCKFFTADKKLPTILYFHGNGETVFDHDWLAPLYLRRGINLFVTDYRGYGASNGQPNISNLIQDSRRIYQGFRKIIKDEGYCDSIFVMGRSLGSVPAMEVAYNYQDELQGIIIESGTAENFQFIRGLLSPEESEHLLDGRFLNKNKIQRITIPTLIIHGELDEILSVEEGIELYENSGTRAKEIVIIPNSGHNDLMLNEEEMYFSSIEQFVKKNS